MAGMQEDRNPGLVVGIGASAGGLEAYRTLFDAMPANTGMAFILVQHLDPDHASALVEILRNSTKMEVSQAENGVAIAANHVFIIPPDAIMKIKGGGSCSSPVPRQRLSGARRSTLFSCRWPKTSARTRSESCFPVTAATERAA